MAYATMIAKGDGIRDYHRGCRKKIGWVCPCVIVHKVIHLVKFGLVRPWPHKVMAYVAMITDAVPNTYVACLSLRGYTYGRSPI